MGFDPRTLRPAARVGKYRITGKLTEGGFARLFRAHDTIEGMDVALKIPSEYPLSASAEAQFRSEIRTNAKLDHPNILPIRNADRIDGMLVVASPLGEESLADRLMRRLSLGKALGYSGQLFDALAYAHGRGIVHCDVKPENVILFPDSRLRLGDFGLARTALRSFAASGSGTVGYMAPEQAMGRPSPRSDVFSAGLVAYRMLAGRLPTWPFDWPLPGHDNLERRVTPGLVHLLRRALRVDARKRFADAGEMSAAFARLLPAQRRHERRGSR